jgi:hypothetical protein
MISQDHRERKAGASIKLGLALKPLLAITLLVLLAGCRQPGPTAPTELNTPSWVTRQHSVDAGYETWRTDPVQVVRSELARYGANQHWNLVMGAPVLNGDIGRWEVEVRATHPESPEQFVVFQLSQPARQGEGGVWVIHRVSGGPR